MTDRLVSVAPAGDRLQTPDGKPLFIVIVNYVGHSDRAWEQFADDRFDADLIEADFRLARQTGANTIRTFVAPPLQNEFSRGDWTKLDAVVRAAERAGVFLLLTLADYGPTYLRTIAAHAGMIAARYRGNPVILGYDLRNEPRFYNLTILHYDAAIPLLAPDLAAIYPPQQSPAEALQWARGEGRAPAWLTDADAINYANAYAIYRRFHETATAWAGASNLALTVVDFMRSADAQPWQPFLDRLDETLKMWLTPQIAAIRAADPGRLLTVGWNDPALAGLPANVALDFLSLHRFPPAAPRWLAYNLQMAAALRAAFAGKPVLLTEFGYSTHELADAQAAICESAVWLRAFELGLAGAGKWMLWDLPPGPNPYERNLGLYTADGAAKPAAFALPALSELLTTNAAAGGNLTLAPIEPIAYRFASADARCAGGDSLAGDDAVRWQGVGLGQIFAYRPQPGLICICATAAGQATLDLSRWPGAPADRTLATLTCDGEPLAHTRVAAALTFAIRPGQIIECRYAADAETAAVDATIAILWPHDNQPVAQAQRANLTAYLLRANSRWAVPCDFANEATLWQAQGNEPARPIAVGVRRLAAFAGRRVPVWDFNDIDVSPARDGQTRLAFMVRVAGVACRSNVWVHGSDARTHMPQPYQAEFDLPILAETAPTEVDARIQILWPHDNAPIGQAERANLSADLFLPATRLRLSPANFGVAWQPTVWLVRAVDNEVGERVAQASPRRDPDGAAHWDFNDIDISPARQAARKVHFWIEVEGVRTCSNIWTHGLDARTNLPHPEPPLGDCS